MLKFAGEARGTDAERRRAVAARKDAKRADKGHQKKPPEQLLTPEQRGERIRAGGGGRPPGSFNVLPMGTIRALQMQNWGAKAGATEAEKELVNLSTEELIKVMVDPRKPKTLPSKLKAIIRVREEVCVPVVSESKVTADISMSNQVRAAQKLVQERKAAREAAKIGEKK